MLSLSIGWAASVSRSHSAPRLQQVCGTFDLSSLSWSVAGVGANPPSVLVLISDKRWSKKPVFQKSVVILHFYAKHLQWTAVWSPKSDSIRIDLLMVSSKDKNELCCVWCFLGKTVFSFAANVILCLWIVRECHSNVYAIKENWICSDLMKHSLAKPLSFSSWHSRNENGSTVSANEDKEMCVNCGGAFSQKMYSRVQIQGCQITLALSKTSVKLRLLMQQLL